MKQPSLRNVAMLMRLHGHEDLRSQCAKPFLRYSRSGSALRQSYCAGGTRVNDANRFSENRRRQGDFGRNRKQQQPLASFQNEVQPSTRHFYDALQAAHGVYSGVQESVAVKGVIRDDF